jgi:hypothetical protein
VGAPLPARLRQPVRADRARRERPARRLRQLLAARRPRGGVAGRTLDPRRRRQQTYPTPFLHHAFTEHDDGAIVWLALDDGYENETLERLDAAGVQSRIWDCQSQFYATIGQIGSCGTNGLYWDAAADRYLISSWAIDTVIEIDGATGALNRYFGQLPGAWSFDPPES